MDEAEYRERSRSSESEQRRIRDLMRLLAGEEGAVLDVGADDGYVSALLAERFRSVVALDLTGPMFEHPGVSFVRADAAALPLEDASFDVVVCTEVLEHVQPELVERACAELGRVARSRILVGVPYRQDTRLGRATCRSCGGKNPPWGHLNVFDEERLRALFPSAAADEVSFVGRSRAGTNRLSTWLMDLAGNPYGAFGPTSRCIHCGELLRKPTSRTFLQKVCARLAVYARALQKPFVRPRPDWVHILWKKGPSSPGPRSNPGTY